jgi:hypothetical protein
MRLQVPSHAAKDPAALGIGAPAPKVSVASMRERAGRVCPERGAGWVEEGDGVEALGAGERC